MKIRGLMGSTRLKGKKAKLLKKALEGAKSAGEKKKRYDIIKMQYQILHGLQESVL